MLGEDDLFMLGEVDLLFILGDEDLFILPPCCCMLRLGWALRGAVDPLLRLGALLFILP